MAKPTRRRGHSIRPLTEGLEPRRLLAVAINEVGGLSTEASPLGIAAGPDGTLWFTEESANKIGRIDTSGHITEYSAGISTGAAPYGIALGPVPMGGGSPNLWFTESGTDQIGEITPQGSVTEFGGLIQGNIPEGITLGPDGNLWFVEVESTSGVQAFGDGAAIGQITPAGVLTEFPLDLDQGYVPNDIATGPDGALWFTMLTPTGGEIGRVTTSGDFTFYPITNGSGSTSSPQGIVEGNSHDLWFADAGNHAIGQITTVGVIQEFSQGLTIADVPTGITASPDGNYWFTDPSDKSNGDPVGRITPQGVITLFPTPTTTAGTAGITVGPDDNLWFTESTADQIGQVVLPQSSLTSLDYQPINPVAGNPFSATVATFTEASTLPTSANFDAMIDWGDGTSSDVVASVGSNGQFTVPGSHTYANSGFYNGSVTVFNAAGSRTLAFSTDVEPVINVSGLSIKATADQAFTMPVANFTDADGPRPTGAYRSTIDWGDGTTSPGTIATDANGKLEVIGTHNYPFTGSYQVTVTVQVIAVPSEIGTGTGSVIVSPQNIYLDEDQNIYATPGVAYAGTLGFIEEFSYTGVSPDYQATINWGDGSPTIPGTILGGNALFGTHVYATLGTFTVSVNIIDLSNGDTAADGLSATVVPAGPIDEVKDGITGTPNSITTGADGNLWFADTDVSNTPGIGRITTGGAVTVFTAGLPAGTAPNLITAGPDGNLWFTQTGTDSIGRITPQGVITEFPTIPNYTEETLAITSGSDGNLWFTAFNYDDGTSFIGRITPQGVFTAFYTGLAMYDISRSITSGPDGNLWFTVSTPYGGDFIDRITTSDVITQFPSSASGESSGSITSGPDGALWFTESDSGGGAQIGRITTSGVVTSFNYGLTAQSVPTGITMGPDGNLWFLDAGLNHVDRITTAGQISTFAIPSGNAEPSSITLGPDDNLWFNEPAYGQIGQIVLPESILGGGETFHAMVGEPIANTIFATFYEKSSLVDLNRFFYPLIAFGDGTLGNGTLVYQSADIYGLETSHTYSTAANFVGEATLTNAVGTSSPAVFTADIDSPIVPPLSFVVTNTNDSGPGSLRQAILNANQVSGHLITFAIPGTGVETIGVTSPLPAITGPSVIDGASQAVFEGVDSGNPLIEIDGQAPFVGVAGGLTFAGNSGGSLLLSVAIFGFSGAQVQVDASGVILFGNVLGLRADGSFPPILFGDQPAASTASPYDNGVNVGAPGVVIGGGGPGEGNVISGNTGWGILIAGASATSDQVIGNLIGLDPTGTLARANGLDGIEVSGGAGREFLGPGNAISGNASDGVHLLGSSGDLITGNVIGTDSSGSHAIANGNDGIVVDQGSSSIVVGGMDPSSTNVISGNETVGVAVQGGSTGIAIASNLIGTDQSGERAIGNGIAGVLIVDSPDNVVGPGNLISGNGVDSPGAGIWIDGPGSIDNLVFGDKIGTDLTGEFPLANSPIGVLIDQASSNAIGDDAFGATNVISGNTSIGVMIAGPGGSQNLVAGNLIGTDARGTKSVPNGSSTQGAGVYLDDASDNAIGGIAAGLGNLISGNGFDGAQIFGPSSSGNLFEGNKVGTNLAGTSRLGNGEDGLLINGAPGTRVVANLIAANALDGITVSGPGASDTTIMNNTIGRGVGGQSLGNGAFGVLVINGAPSPMQVGNVNVNNTFGPIRDTSVAAITPPTSSKTLASKKVVKVTHAKAKPSSPRAIHPKAKAKVSPAKSPKKK